MYKRAINFNNLRRGFYNVPSKVFGVAQNIPCYSSNENPKVFFSVAKDGDKIGNLTFEVK